MCGRPRPRPVNDRNHMLFPEFTAKQKCIECGHRSDDFYCNLPTPVLEELETIRVSTAFPKGATVFAEGHTANGVYMLCSGRVKFSTYSRDGKALIIRIASAGELLGLSSILAESPLEATASALEPCRLHFYAKGPFLRFLLRHPQASFNAAKQLSRDYSRAHTQICSLGLSNTVADKLARLLTEWCRTTGHTNGAAKICISMPFTHEDLAEMIGSSRETVTRILKDFRGRGLIEFGAGDTVTIDRRRIESFLGSAPITANAASATAEARQIGLTKSGSM